MKYEIIKWEQMCCIICGYIAKENEEFDYEQWEEEEIPICPECGNHNTGGYRSFAPAGLWSGKDLEYLVGLRNRDTEMSGVD